MALILGLSFAITPITSYAQTNDVDWTPLFKSWENQCATNSQLDKLMKSMIPTPRPNVVNYQHTKFRVKKLNLPMQYQSAIFDNPVIKIHSLHDNKENNTDDEDISTTSGYYEVILSTSGYYYGMPLVNIGLLAGVDNGIHTQSITVDMPIDKVKNILSKKSNIRYRTIKIESSDDYDSAFTGSNTTTHYEQVGIQFYKDDKNPSYTRISCDYST